MIDQYDDDNIFAKILEGKAPCIKVYEDEHSLAFMDIMPQRQGHVLVIPRERAVTIYELSSEAMRNAMEVVQKLGKAVERATGLDGTTIFQQNGKDSMQTVPHVHFHILPGSFIGVKGHAAELAKMDELQAMADRIMAEL